MATDRVSIDEFLQAILNKPQWETTINYSENGYQFWWTIPIGWFFIISFGGQTHTHTPRSDREKDDSRSKQQRTYIRDVIINKWSSTKPAVSNQLSIWRDEVGIFFLCVYNYKSSWFSSSRGVNDPDTALTIGTKTGQQHVCFLYF